MNPTDNTVSTEITLNSIPLNAVALEEGEARIKANLYILKATWTEKEEVSIVVSKTVDYTMYYYLELVISITRSLQQRQMTPAA